MRSHSLRMRTLHVRGKSGLNAQDTQPWYCWRYDLGEVLIASDHDIVPFKGLCRDPEIILVDLQQLATDTIGPALDPARNAPPNVDPRQRDARLDRREGVCRMPRDLGKRMRLGLNEASLNVGECLPRRTR